MKDCFLKNVKIDDLYFEDGQIKRHFTGNLNMHGTEIIKVLLKECEDIKIVSIRTLRENNKCRISDIIGTIQYCIDINVDIINLSLGCSANTRKINMLEEVCKKAANKGIIIIAADNNIPSIKSYPANFEFVIGVTTTDTLKGVYHVNYQNRIIEFSKNLVYIPNSTNYIIRRGNSYLCPFITGLLCSFVGNRKISNNTIQEFMNFLVKLNEQQITPKVFFDRNSDFDKGLLKNKKVLFFIDNMDLNNIRIYNIYKKICDINICFNDIYNAKPEAILKYIEDYDMFFLGALSNQFLLNNKNFMEMLTRILASRSMLTITVLPIVNTYQRVCMALNSDFYLKSIYK